MLVITFLPFPPTNITNPSDFSPRVRVKAREEQGYMVCPTPRRILTILTRMRGGTHVETHQPINDAE